MSDEPKKNEASVRPDIPLWAENPSKIRHELRTPINQILGYSELLQEEAEATEQQAFVPDLQKIQFAARRLLGMLDALFTASGRHTVPKVEGPVSMEGSGVRWAPVSAGEPASAPAPASAPPAQVPAPAAEAPKEIEAPVRKEEPVLINADEEPGEEKVAETAHLLVVDDNEMNRDMLSRRLQAKGFTTQVAEDGESALRTIDAGKFDTVLLDVVMPGLSGIDVLKILRQRFSVADLPIIMATGLDASKDIVEALKLGANDYVTKPLDFPVVLARIRTQLSLKRAKERIEELAEDLERKNRFIRKTFGRYLSEDVVESLLDSEEGLKLGGEMRTVTIMMSDLRGFTAAAERLSPEQVVKGLNNYLGCMADIITEYRGTIDEFIGDAILSIFGAPLVGEDDAQRAVACALTMQQAMASINEWNEREGLPKMEMGIAVNTGEVVVGNIGSQTRAKYGIVGSHVNLTARIESMSVGGQVLISESTLLAAGDIVKVGRRLQVQAKGFSEPITAFEVKGIGGKYAVELEDKELPLVTPKEPIAIRFSILHEKEVGGEHFDGRIVRLSMESGEVRSEKKVSALTNVKARVFGEDGSEIGADLYAKVVEASLPSGDPGFVLRFTSVPPPVVKRFQALVG